MLTYRLNGTTEASASNRSGRSAVFQRPDHPVLRNDDARRIIFANPRRANGSVVLTWGSHGDEPEKTTEHPWGVRTA